jgi:hypothetical protein
VTIILLIENKVIYGDKFKPAFYIHESRSLKTESVNFSDLCVIKGQVSRTKESVCKIKGLGWLV